MGYFLFFCMNLEKKVSVYHNQNLRCQNLAHFFKKNAVTRAFFLQIMHLAKKVIKKNKKCKNPFWGDWGKL